MGVVVLAAPLTGVLGLTVEPIAGGHGVVIVSLALLYLVLQLVSGGLDATEKKRMVVIFVLFIFSAMFWSGFEQAGSSLNLFAERLTDLNVFGWEMPASWLQSVNPLLIIALAPVFAWLWVALARRSTSRRPGQVLARPDPPRPRLRRHGLGVAPDQRPDAGRSACSG